jgi:hypothetical protein
MELAEAREGIGRRVAYRPHAGAGEPERGVITSVNDTYVFVAYDAGAPVQATNPLDLAFLEPVERWKNRYVTHVVGGPAWQLYNPETGEIREWASFTAFVENRDLYADLLGRIAEALGPDVLRRWEGGEDPSFLVEQVRMCALVARESRS